MSQPLAIDLFCGLGGWAEGLLAAGWRVFGFDIERHQYGDKRYPAEMVIQDVLTLHGSQFKNASLIVARPPCQKYSYMAMPWTRAKEMARGYRASGERRAELNELFDACFRIQREASEAAGHHIPLIVENVKGAQPWVGQAKWHYGSYYLWGDVPALMPQTTKRKSSHVPLVETPAGAGRTSWFFGNSKGEGRHYGLKIPGQNWSRFKESGEVSPHWRMAVLEGVKVQGLPSGDGWFGRNNRHALRRHSSKSNARKQASAEIAKIPFPLAHWIGEVFR